MYPRVNCGITLSKEETMRYVFPNGSDATLTTAQRQSLDNVVQRWGLVNTVEVSPMFGGDGAVIVDVGQMFLAVETDGYVHS
jgi:hypothetical protein